MLREGSRDATLMEPGCFGSISKDQGKIRDFAMNA
jgi:hypothetical protein